ncbi:MAG: hypothetical protein J6D02_13605 [Lachnospira sp.]|nr:hypothetical protein [Lachnospira sp.]
MKECKRLKCPKNKGLQGFARVRKRAKALPDDEELEVRKLEKSRVVRVFFKKRQQKDNIFDTHNT